MQSVFRWVLLCAFALAVAEMFPELAWGLEWGCALSSFNPSMNYNPWTPDRTTLNATVHNGIDCTGTPAQQVMVCVHIKTEDSQNQRLLAKDAYRLNFTIESNSAGTGFGSSDWYSSSGGSGAYARLVTIGADGHGLADLPLYMSIPSGQWVAPGIYTALIPPIVSLTYRINGAEAFNVFGALACSSGLPVGSVAATYNFQATVVAICDVSSPVPPLDFGHVSTLSFNIDTASSLIRVRCTATTPYSITLNNGLSPDMGNFLRRSAKDIRRMRLGSTSNYIDYSLYQNTARTLLWKEDEVLKTTTPAGPVNGPWDGPWQDHTISGRVPSRMLSLAPPVPGVYSDRVVITINY